MRCVYCGLAGDYFGPGHYPEDYDKSVMICDDCIDWVKASHPS